MKTEAWEVKLKEMIPSYGQSLCENTELSDQIREKTSKVLKLNNQVSA